MSKKVNLQKQLNTSFRGFFKEKDCSIPRLKKKVGKVEGFVVDKIKPIPNSCNNESMMLTNVRSKLESNSK